MSSAERMASLRARLLALEARVGDIDGASVLRGFRATVGDVNAIKAEPLAKAAREKLLDLTGASGPPTDEEYEALVRVLVAWRPVVGAAGGHAGVLPDLVMPAFPRWDGFRTAVDPWVRSVGRVQTFTSGIGWTAFGTAFVVSESLVATNVHVWDDVRDASPRLTFNSEIGEATVDPRELTCVRSSNSADLVLLGFTGQSPPPLELTDEAVTEGEDIAVIGHPMDDGRPNVAVVAVFGDFPKQLGPKRFAPGRVTGLASARIEHDASTLGGNSGSPVVRQSDAKVIGVHQQGTTLESNTAIAVGELRNLLKKP